VAQAERWREGRVTKGINDIGQDPLHCGAGGMVGKGGTIDGGLTWGKVKTKEGRAAVWGGGRRRGAIWGGGEGRGWVGGDEGKKSLPHYSWRSKDVDIVCIGNDHSTCTN
jgi:hypothetical protein